MMRASLVFVLLALGSLACGKTRSDRSATESAPIATMSCDAIFAAPANGELLCEEQDASVRRGRWRSYGMAEDRSTLCDRYLNAARQCDYGFIFKPPLCDVTDHKTNRRTALFFTTPTSMGGADYPTCSRAPSPKHQTVLVVYENDH